MNGVTIIEEHFYRALSLEALIISISIVLLLCCAGAFAIWWIYKKDTSTDKKSLKRQSVRHTILLGAMFVGFVLLQISTYNDTHMEYTIKVDDSASFNEVYSTYEILSGSENTFRVKEK